MDTLSPVVHYVSKCSLYMQYINSKGSLQIKKCHKKWKKFTIFLTPPPSPRMFWTFLNLGRIGNLMTPPLPNLGKIRNWENFEKVQISNFGLFYVFCCPPPPCALFPLFVTFSIRRPPLVSTSSCISVTLGSI